MLRGGLGHLRSMDPTGSSPVHLLGWGGGKRTIRETSATLWRSDAALVGTVVAGGGTPVKLRVGAVQETHHPLEIAASNTNPFFTRCPTPTMTRAIITVENSDILGFNLHRGIQTAGRITFQCPFCYGRTHCGHNFQMPAPIYMPSKSGRASLHLVLGQGNMFRNFCHTCAEAAFRWKH